MMLRAILLQTVVSFFDDIILLLKLHKYSKLEISRRISRGKKEEFFSFFFLKFEDSSKIEFKIQ